VAFRGVREEATLGARTTLDVLNAEQELLDARASLIAAQVDELAAGYTLLAAMGELTAQKLRLKVRIYDPAGYYNMVKDAPAGMSAQGKKLDRVLRRVENK
jgi:outer membrane protein